jgi:hypothetical protein
MERQKSPTAVKAFSFISLAFTLQSKVNSVIFCEGGTSSKTSTILEETTHDYTNAGNVGGEDASSNFNQPTLDQPTLNQPSQSQLQREQILEQKRVAFDKKMNDPENSPGSQGEQLTHKASGNYNPY